MGNQHSAAHALKPRKNVHWKSPGVPAAPGRPDVEPVTEEGAVALRWTPAASHGSAQLLGYQVECRRADGSMWLGTAPPLVKRPDLVLAGLPPQRYQFRVAALSTAGVSDYSLVSSLVTVGAMGPQAPCFTQPLHDICVFEGDTAEFRASFVGTPPLSVSWFKDDYEIFSSRRTLITTDTCSSVLIFHQTLDSDDGEVKCTATNRAGHAVSRARLRLEAPPRLRYPRQYEDGLLYQINETIYLKTTVVGRPTPTMQWLHDGHVLTTDTRVQLVYRGGVASLKILSAKRSDRGEYQIRATSCIGEDAAAFLVTVTAPPEPPRQLTVLPQLDRSIILRWKSPTDDGGCRVSNYVVEYFRAGWDVWLRATTSRQPTATLYDLIEGSEYRFRVKAESPYGMSAPSKASSVVHVGNPPRHADALAHNMRFLADALQLWDGDTTPHAAMEPHFVSNKFVTYDQRRVSMITTGAEYGEGLVEGEGEEPPPLSLSAPELSTRELAPHPSRLAASSTDLLHEQAMLRMYHAIALRDQRARRLSLLSILPSFMHETSSCAPNTTFLPPTHASFEEDYTDSTVSTEYSDEQPDSRKKLTKNHETPSPFAETPSPLDETAPYPADAPSCVPPDLSFVPKPILKRREPEPEPLEIAKLAPALLAEKYKQDKLSIFKKFPKMPVQKLYPFANIFNKKQIYTTQIPIQISEDKASTPIKTRRQIENKISDEVVFVIEHYEKIVKEYGDQKRLSTPLHINKKELKITAVQQSEEEMEKPAPEKSQEVLPSTPFWQTDQGSGNCTGPGHQWTTCSAELGASTSKTDGMRKRTSTTSGAVTPKPVSPDIPAPLSAASSAVLMRTAPNATLVKPIDYVSLEQQATASVRTAIDCIVDACLLVLAFYLYLFRDERLALGPLTLLASRQLRGITLQVPYWLRAPHRHIA